MDTFRFKLPPGPSFLLQRLFSVKVISYTALIGGIRIGGEMLGVDLPLWAIVSSSLAALPALIYTQSEFQYWRTKRRAKSLGARLPPKVPYKWPAGVDLIATMINVLKTGYLGEPDDLNTRQA